MCSLWTNAVKTVGGTFEWERDSICMVLSTHFLRGVWRGVDSYSTEAVVMPWLVMALLGSKLKT